MSLSHTDLRNTAKNGHTTAHDLQKKKQCMTEIECEKYKK